MFRKRHMYSSECCHYFYDMKHLKNWIIIKIFIEQGTRIEIYFASCQILLNSVQRLHIRSQKCLSQSEARVDIFFPIGIKNTKLRSCFLSSFVEFRSAVAEEKSTMSQPIRGQSGRLVFPIGRKNTNWVENLEILLPVKFH